MQVNLNMTFLSRIPDDMRQIQRKLKVYESELEQVKRELGTLSEMDEPVRKLDKCKTQIKSEIGYFILFENTLNQIHRQYTSTEEKIIKCSFLKGGNETDH